MEESPAINEHMHTSTVHVEEGGNGGEGPGKGGMEGGEVLYIIGNALENTTLPRTSVQT